MLRNLTPEQARKRLKKLRYKWWDEGRRICGICGKEIVDFYEYVLDHKKPGKMGGCKDHSEENLGPAHWLCNLEKGSKRWKH